MKKTLLIIMAALMILSTAGCVKFKKKTAPTAGLYKTFDRGDSWLQKSLAIVGGKAVSFSHANIEKIYMDPQDNNAIYLASSSFGMFYTYDGGESWFQPKQLSSGKINSIAINPQNKCNIYVALGNQVIKSNDCSRTWQEVYFDKERRTLSINALAINNLSTGIIYSGNSVGEVLKSIDYGNSWTTIKRFKNAITKILIDKQNPDILYVAMSGGGVFKTLDGGIEWVDLNSSLKKYSQANNVLDLMANPSRDNSIFMLNRYGIMKTDDGGETWQIINLITTPLQTYIYSLGVNPKNENELFYGTASAFYRTTNGGANWTVKRLPTQAIASALLVDPVNPKIIYLGIKIPQQ